METIQVGLTWAAGPFEAQGSQPGGTRGSENKVKAEERSNVPLLILKLEGHVQEYRQLPMAHMETGASFSYNHKGWNFA